MKRKDRPFLKQEKETDTMVLPDNFLVLPGDYARDMVHVLDDQELEPEHAILLAQRGVAWRGVHEMARKYKK